MYTTTTNNIMKHKDQRHHINIAPKTGEDILAKMTDNAFRFHIYWDGLEWRKRHNGRAVKVVDIEYWMTPGWQTK